MNFDWGKIALIVIGIAVFLALLPHLMVIGLVIVGLVLVVLFLDKSAGGTAIDQIIEKLRQKLGG